MYLTTVKELGTALLTKGTAFALDQTATQTNNSSVNDVLDSAQEVTASTADEVNRFVQYFNDTATTEIYTLSLHDALPIFFIFYFSLSFSELFMFFLLFIHNHIDNLIYKLQHKVD